MAGAPAKFEIPGTDSRFSSGAETAERAAPEQDVIALELLPKSIRAEMQLGEFAVAESSSAWRDADSAASSEVVAEFIMPPTDNERSCSFCIAWNCCICGGPGAEKDSKYAAESRRSEDSNASSHIIKSSPAHPEPAINAVFRKSPAYANLIGGWRRHSK